MIAKLRQWVLLRYLWITIWILKCRSYLSTRILNDSRIQYAVRSPHYETYFGQIEELCRGKLLTPGIFQIRIVQKGSQVARKCNFILLRTTYNKMALLLKMTELGQWFGIYDIVWEDEAIEGDYSRQVVLPKVSEDKYSEGIKGRFC